MKYYLLCLLLLLFLNSALSQNKDSTAGYIDTVIIYKAPHVIRKKVYVENPVEPSFKWYVQLLFGGGFFKNNYPVKGNEVNISNELKKALIPKYSTFIGLSLFKEFEEWDLGVGIQLQSYKEGFENARIVIGTDSMQVRSRDTLDIYFNIKEQDTIYHYIIEDKQRMEYRAKLFNEYISAKNSSLFLEIPITFKYKILEESISLKIIGGFTPAFLLAASGKIISKDLSETKIRNIEKKDFSLFSIRTSLGLEVAYPISSKIRVSFSPLFSTQLTRLSAEALPFNLRRNSLSLQGGIQYRF